MKGNKFNEHWLYAIIPGLIAIAVVVFIVSLLLIKLVWAWTVPDLFPGAVAAGLVASSISWYTAFKLAVFVAIMAAVAGVGHGHGKDHYNHE